METILMPGAEIYYDKNFLGWCAASGLRLQVEKLKFVSTKHLKDSLHKHTSPLIQAVDLFVSLLKHVSRKILMN